jgi:hypothetical protein
MKVFLAGMSVVLDALAADAQFTAPARQPDDGANPLAGDNPLPRSQSLRVGLDRSSPLSVNELDGALLWHTSCIIQSRNRLQRRK